MRSGGREGGRKGKRRREEERKGGRRKKKNLLKSNKTISVVELGLKWAVSLGLSAAGPNANLQAYEIMKGKSSSEILRWLLPKQAACWDKRLIPPSLAKNIFFIYLFSRQTCTCIEKSRNL